MSRVDKHMSVIQEEITEKIGHKLFMNLDPKWLFLMFVMILIFILARIFFCRSTEVDDYQELKEKVKVERKNSKLLYY